MTAEELRTIIDRLKKPYSHNGSEMSITAANVRRSNDERMLLIFIGERLLRAIDTGCPMNSEGP